ncbi:MAG: DUF1127 domain-containing protein [Paracoccaceae bacterium]
MAVIETTRPAPFGAISVFHAITALDHVRKGLIDWNNRRITRNVLSSLSDRQLDDIGIARGDISRF